MTNLVRKLTLSVFFTWLCLPSLGTAMDLNEALTLALERDPAFQADLYDADAKNAEGWGDIAGLGPTLTASASYMQNKESLTPEEEFLLPEEDSLTPEEEAFIPEDESLTEEEKPKQEARSAHYGESEMSVEFNQPLVDLERYSLAARGDRKRKLADIQKKKAREQLILRVHERYYQVLAAQVNLGISEAESNALKRQVQAAKDKLDIGFGIVTDVYDAEARYRLSRADELNNQAELDAKRQALTELIVKEITGNLDDLRSDYVLPVIPGEIKGWLAMAKEHNTDYGSSKLQQDVAEYDSLAAKSKFAPSLVLFAGYKQNNPDGGLYGFEQERIEANMGLRLEIDLLNGGVDMAASVEKNYRYRAARQRAIAVLRATNRSVRTTWDTLNSTRALITAYDEAVRSNEQALEFTKAAYREGAKILLDVLNAQRVYYDAMAQYRNARYDYMILLAQFESYVGVPVNRYKSPQKVEKTES